MLGLEKHFIKMVNFKGSVQGGGIPPAFWEAE
jgi:hypothetical protein